MGRVFPHRILCFFLLSSKMPVMMPRSASLHLGQCPPSALSCNGSCFSSPYLMLLHSLLKNAHDDAAKRLSLRLGQFSRPLGNGVELRILAFNPLYGLGGRVLPHKNGIFLIHASGTNVKIFAAASLSPITAVESPTSICFCSVSVKSLKHSASPRLFQVSLRPQFKRNR